MFSPVSKDLLIIQTARIMKKQLFPREHTGLWTDRKEVYLTASVRRPLIWRIYTETIIRNGSHSNNQTMSDHVFVNGVRRGSFRLHPLNTDGSGVSWGCITLYHSTDFQLLRRLLLSKPKVRVPGGNGLMAYGRIDVRGVPDFSKCIAK